MNILICQAVSHVSIEHGKTINRRAPISCDVVVMHSSIIRFRIRKLLLVLCEV